MKTTICGVKLIGASKKNILPIGKGIFGFLKLKHDLSSAEFKEETPTCLYERKSIRLKHGRGFYVSFNPENNTYRITISVNADTPDWYMVADENFEHCLNFVERRIE